jgi:DNA-binding transcriptional ArsR family regulator
MVDHSTTLERVFSALSDTTRLQMVERLGRGPASVTELAEPLAMSLAAVLQHVQILEACGLVRSQKVGRVRTCRIEPSTLEAVGRWVTERRAEWERRFDRLGELLDTDHPSSPTRKDTP